MAKDEAFRALERKVDQLTRQLSAVEDKQQVRTLHFMYGYYLDMCLYQEVCDLFAQDGSVRFLNGLYKGRAGISRLYLDWFRQMFTKGHNGPVFGFLLDHLMLQDVVTLSADGNSALLRVRALNMIGYHDEKPEKLEHMPQQFWGGGIYENEYVKENSVWKISRLDYVGRWQAPYEQGWAHSSGHLPPFDKTFPENPIGPDVLLPEAPCAWPKTAVVPFHYAHPITGVAWPKD